jgi:hypothetical protein
MSTIPPWAEEVFASFDDDEPHEEAACARHDQYRGNGAARLIQSSGEFVAGFVPPAYLIDGLLNRQFLYALTGPTGHGKTAVMLRIAVHVALGLPLDNRQVEKCRVLFFAGENPVTARRLRIVAGSGQAARRAAVIASGITGSVEQQSFLDNLLLLVLADLEHLAPLTLNQRVQGSSPCAPTKKNQALKHRFFPRGTAAKGPVHTSVHTIRHQRPRQGDCDPKRTQPRPVTGECPTKSSDGPVITPAHAAGWCDRPVSARATASATSASLKCPYPRTASIAAVRSRNWERFPLARQPWPTSPLSIARD